MDGTDVWSLALEGKDDLERFKELGWGLRTWDLWEWNDCLPREIYVNNSEAYFTGGDRRFGDDWPARHREHSGEAGGPGRIPAQLIAHILYYFSKQKDLILDPMAGGGVTADTCLALNRRCWAYDMIDRPDTRPEIEPYYWGPKGHLESAISQPQPHPRMQNAGVSENQGFLNSKGKPDLIILDPPYFDKKAEDYPEKSISRLPKKEYLEFFAALFALLKHHAKKTTRLAFINADWRDFQNKPAAEESHGESILIDDYLKILNKTGWWHTHIIQAPMSAERFTAVVVSAMQKKRILGVTSLGEYDICSSRYVIILRGK